VFGASVTKRFFWTLHAILLRAAQQTLNLLKKPEWNSEKTPSHKVGSYWASGKSAASHSLSVRLNPKEWKNRSPF
jgi:hypothetical protein